MDKLFVKLFFQLYPICSFMYLVCLLKLADVRCGVVCGRHDGVSIDENGSVENV